MFLLVFNHPLQDGHTGRISEGFELLAVFGDIAAFVDFQTAQSQIVAPDAVLEAVSIAGRLASVDWLRLPQLPQSACPQRGMFLFCNRHVFEGLLAPRLALPLGERAIGVIAGHFCLPVLFQDLGQPWMAGQGRYGLRDSVQLLLQFRILRAQVSTLAEGTLLWLADDEV